MRNVRDMHAQKVIVAHFFQRYGVVDVAGILAVDGDDKLVAEISARCDIFLRDFTACLFIRFFFHCRREFFP